MTERFPKTVKLKTFVLVTAILLALLATSIQYARTIYVGNVTEVWVQPPLHEAGYVVGVYNSTYYYAKNGTTGEMDFIGTSLTTVINSAITALGTNGGTIYLREVQKPNDVTVPNNVLIIEDYQGDRTYYGDIIPAEFILGFRKVGQYFTTGIGATAKTTLLITANRLYAIPFFCTKTINIDRIAIHVSTAASGYNARLGIYVDDGTTNPATATLIIDAGEVTVGSTGKQELTISVTLKGGRLYWLALVSGGAPTLGAVAVGSMIPSIFGLTDITTTAWLTFAYKSFTYGALPNPFGTTITLASGSCPAVFVRIAA